jgi:hypothetical protein
MVVDPVVCLLAGIRLLVVVSRVLSLLVWVLMM